MTSVGFLGIGHALPERVRTNADPIFSHAKQSHEAALFAGIEERRVLRADESIEQLTAAAARIALDKAGIDVAQIDRLYGTVSPSENILPSGLFSVHAMLGLRETTMIVPVACDFTNFLMGCTLAREAIASGACTHALVVCGSAWTRNVDYRHPHAWSIGDGAAAAVLGPSDRMVWLGHGISTHSHAAESMTLRLRARDEGILPTFLINEHGIQVFNSLGMQQPPRLLMQLMAEHHVSADNLTLIGHQASTRLTDCWADQIKPRAYVSSLKELGNMTVANVGVNLARSYESIGTDYVGCISLGLGSHFMVGLIQRSKV